MPYLSLIYDAQFTRTDMSADETSGFMGEHRRVTDDIIAKGIGFGRRVATGAHGPQLCESATTVCPPSTSVYRSQGTVRWLVLNDARDFTQAIQIAARIPSARTGSVEVGAVSMQISWIRT